MSNSPRDTSSTTISSSIVRYDQIYKNFISGNIFLIGKFIYNRALDLFYTGNYSVETELFLELILFPGLELAELLNRNAEDFSKIIIRKVELLVLRVNLLWKFILQIF